MPVACPRLRSRGTTLGAAHLAELEAAAWKDDRRFRVLTVDQGVVSFSDLYFNTPSKVPPPPSAASAASARVVDGYSISSQGACRGAGLEPWNPREA